MIERGLEKTGKSKGGLAAAMGVRPGAVSEILGGERLVKASEIIPIMEYLELNLAPIMGRAEQVSNFYMDVGWGTYGFKASPISGKCMAELIATGKTPALIEPFSPARFRTGRLVGEKAAAAVSH